MDKNNSLVKAINKNVRTSPRKLSLVCNFIKGKKGENNGKISLERPVCSSKFIKKNW